ncbi:MAG: tetratricopeptide repeat protein [Hyphomicrobiaceae bacterium]
MGAALVWLLVTHTLVAYLAKENPGLALELAPGNPPALIQQAAKIISKIEAEHPGSRELSALPTFEPSRVGIIAATARQMSADEGPDKTNEARPRPVTQPLTTTDRDHLRKARGMIKRALERAPLTARAWTLLGRIEDLETPAADWSEKAEKYYREAARLSLHQSHAIYWLMRRNMDRQNDKAALVRADQLLRTNPNAAPFVIPALAQLAEAPLSNGAVKALLNNNPPWRHQFFSSVTNYITDARTPLDLLLATQKTPAPATIEDWRNYIKFLIHKGFYQLAYSSWLQLLPKDQLRNAGTVFNSGFETEFSGLPFDWVVSKGTGARIHRAPDPLDGNNMALELEFVTGRIEFGGVSEIIALAPGTYILKGRLRGELTGKRGLVWSVSCLPKTSEPLAETPMQFGMTPRWKTFELQFVVPRQRCETQMLHLRLDARSASEKLVRGTMWYDDIKIARTDEQADK